MNFDDTLKRYLPRVWFRFKFIKYKYLGRGEPELRLIRHLVEPGTTAIDVGASIGMYSAEMARYAGKVLAFEANPDVAAFTRAVAAPNIEVINVALSSHAGRATLTMPMNARDMRPPSSPPSTADRRPARTMSARSKSRRGDSTIFRFPIAASSRSTWKATRKRSSTALRR